MKREYERPEMDILLLEDGVIGTRVDVIEASTGSNTGWSESNDGSDL